MVNMISPSENDIILEPCGGDGDFIDALLDFNDLLSIDTCDLNSQTVDALKEKYKSFKNIKIRQADTLTDEIFDGYVSNGHYDKIIGNPPYGAWQEYKQRELLKKKYNGFYVKETYSLFLLRCVSILKTGGVLSFIIPDTFLFLHNHKELRSYLLTNTFIKEILIFPSKFFPGVSFGYSNLSIITVQKVNWKKEALNNVFTVIKGFTSDRELDYTQNEPNHLSKIKLKQEDVFNTEYHAFMLNDEGIDKLILSTTTCLGDFANCVTGIYSGDNRKFILADNKQVKGSKEYQEVDKSLVDYNCASLKGTSKDKRYVPLVKGSSKSKYVRKDIDWFINWCEEAIKHYNSDKKARFQNSAYYFQKGIALPMVKSSKITATIMNGMVFDQSIVGVFLKEDKYFYYLLGLLNSDIFNKIIHVINPTANNSANYLRKAPVPFPTAQELIVIDKLVKAMVENPENEQAEKALNALFNELYNRVNEEFAI